MDNIKITIEEKPLNEDEILILDALVKSPAFAVIRKLVRIQRAQELSQLVSSVDRDTMIRTQGKIQGLNMVEFLPLTLQSLTEKLKAKRAAEEEKAKKKRQ